MATCEICNKKLTTATQFTMRGSYVTKRTNRVQKPNIRKVRILENGNAKSINICAKCLRSDKVTRA